MGSNSNPNASQLNTSPGVTRAAYLSYVDDSGSPQSITFDLVETEEWNEPVTITEHPVEIGADVADHVRVGLPEVTLEVFVTNEPSVSNQFGDPALQPLSLQLGAPSWKPGSGQLQVTGWQSSLTLRALGATLVGMGAGAAAGFPASAIASVIAGDVLALTVPGSQSTDSVQTDAGLQPTAVATTIKAQTFQWSGGQDFVEAMHALLVELKEKATLFTVYGTKEIQPNMVIESLTFHRSSDEGTGERVRITLKQVRIVATQTVAAPIPNLPAGGGLKPQKKGAQDPTPASGAQMTSVSKSIANALAAAGGNPITAIAALFGASVPGLP